MAQLITPYALKGQLSNDRFQLVDARYQLGPEGPEQAKKCFEAAHIPGALWLNLKDFSDASHPAPHMFPGVKAFRQHWQQAGLSFNKPTVFIHDEELPTAFRWWWMAQLAGLPDPLVLDGGMKAWLAAGLPTESGQASIEQGYNVVQHSSDEVPTSEAVGRIELEEVAKLVNGKSSQLAQLLDARGEQRFLGQMPESREGCRAGHIPGSLNLPYAWLLEPETGRLKAPAEVEALLNKAGIDWTKGVVTTCGSGVTACVLAFALRYVGFTHAVSVYDGSWAEWGASEQPVESVIVA